MTTLILYAAAFVELVLGLILLIAGHNGAESISGFVLIGFAPLTFGVGVIVREVSYLRATRELRLPPL